ncbi:MAG: hypothetical protein QOJ16_623, partial [Acidobacteriota bacterium]|nr:hypothetical protein [Acidobacteriota bacterium]
MRRAFALAALLLGVAITAVPAWGQPEFPSPVRETVTPAHVVPKPLQNIGYDQKLGESLPLAARVRDEAGRDVPLGSFFGPR